MLVLVAKILTEHWKPFSLVIVALGFVYLGLMTDHYTVRYLDTFFISEVEAQGLSKRIGDVETKVDSLTEDFKASRRALIERDVFRLRVEACMHEAGTARALYEDQIAKLVSEWRSVTGQLSGTPPAPTCGDLGR